MLIVQIAQKLKTIYNMRTGGGKMKEIRRKLDTMPADMRFWIDETKNKLCHATGYEVCSGDPENPANWWNEYVDNDGFT